MTHPWRDAPPLDRARWAWLVALPLLAALGFGLGTAPRTDLLGHWLAGWGGTLGASWLVARAAHGNGWAVVVSVLACIGLGWLLETHVFAIATYDPIDFGAQSLGAALAGFGLVHARAGDPDLDPADGSSPLARSALGRAIAGLSSAGLVLGAVFAFA